jgi:hypothetical protein
MIIEGVVLISLILLIILSYTRKNKITAETIIYTISLIAFLLMKYIIYKNKEKVKQGDCPSKVVGLLAGMVFDGLAIGISIYCILIHIYKSSSKFSE